MCLLVGAFQEFVTKDLLSKLEEVKRAKGREIREAMKKLPDCQDVLSAGIAGMMALLK